MERFAHLGLALLLGFLSSPPLARDSVEVSLRTGVFVEPGEATSSTPVQRIIVAQRSCKAVQTCREAVVMWCGGYSAADRDNDGIPCENVCRSLAQVEAIKKEIGCSK